MEDSQIFVRHILDSDLEYGAPLNKYKWKYFMFTCSTPMYLYKDKKVLIQRNMYIPMFITISLKIAKV